MGALLDELHDRLGCFQGLFRIVRDAQLIEHIRKAHHPQPDFAVAAHHGGDFRQRIAGHVNGVVKKPDRHFDHVFEPLEIDGRSLLGLVHKLGQVYRAQVAGLQGQQGLFAARIGTLNGTQTGRRVIAIDPVQENDSRVPVFPRLGHQGFIDLRGIQAADRFLTARIDQVVFGTLGGGFHKRVGHPHRNIEVVQLVVVFFAVNKLHDVRVVHPQNGHVGPPAGAALLDLFGGGIKNFHKRNRSRGHPAGGADHAVFRPQPREGKAGAASGFMNQGGIFQGTENPVHAVFHRQDKAGCQLSEPTAGIHQGR